MELTKKQKELLKSLSTHEQLTVAMYVVEKVAGSLISARDKGKLNEMDEVSSEVLFVALQGSFNLIKDLRGELESVVK